MVEQKGADPGSLCDGCEGFLRFWWQFWGPLFAVYVGVEICGDPRLWRGEGGLSWPPQQENWLRDCSGQEGERPVGMGLCLL